MHLNQLQCIHEIKELPCTSPFEVCQDPPNFQGCDDALQDRGEDIRQRGAQLLCRVGRPARTRNPAFDLVPAFAFLIQLGGSMTERSASWYRTGVHLLLGILVLLQLVDFATTVLGLQAGQTEKNRFILLLAHYLTIWGALLIAKLASLGGIYLMYLAWRDNPQIFGAPSMAIKLCTGIYLLVVFNNIQLI